MKDNKNKNNNNMRQFLKVLTGRRMSRQCQEFLIEFESSDDENNNKNNFNHVNNHHHDNRDCVESCASTTEIHSLFFDGDDNNLPSSYCSDTSSLLKIRTCQESLEQSYRSSSSSSSSGSSTATATTCPSTDSSSSLSSNSDNKPRVRFSCVTVHYHSVVLGQKALPPPSSTSKASLSSPSLSSSGLAVSLGWKRLDSQTFDDIDQYEWHRRRQCGRRSGRTLQELRIPRKQRELLLLQLFAACSSSSSSGGGGGGGGDGTCSSTSAPPGPQTTTNTATTGTCRVTDDKETSCTTIIEKSRSMMTKGPRRIPVRKCFQLNRRGDSIHGQ